MCTNLIRDIADDKLQELLFMSKRVSVKSAKASVVVDAVGGPSSVPQKVQEAGKVFFPRCVCTLISTRS